MVAGGGGEGGGSNLIIGGNSLCYITAVMCVLYLTLKALKHFFYKSWGPKGFFLNHHKCLS